ncbi:MAG: MalY/PatB family protein [Evtepia sp.]|uniref:MalY/PatB family protein n=1 Tax=Evtepia sp. TaxID=2773933 RepID=UPI002A764A26|nr:MalY/PatB family protein [Evtepia sp.]MDY3015032.1 MalY/PatB family protein [Evtepia sp.]
MSREILQEISLLDRRGTDCAKWDSLQDTFGREDLLPMWVADMDFKTPQCIRQALRQAAEQGMFGYLRVPERYYASVLGWEARRHGNHLEKEWLRWTPGVVAGLFRLVQAITEPGDPIMIQTPVYYPFFRVIRNTGRTMVCNPLREDHGVYTVDMEDFERKLEEHSVKVFLLCSPHNPVGRVWKKEELKAMLDCCRRHGVQVVADEIHHDMLMPGHTHIPAASLWEGEGAPATFFSASKTFNLAGVKHSILVLPDASLREKFDGFQKTIGAADGSTLDYVAVTAAFEEGDEWLDTVLEEIHGNNQLMRQRLEDIPGVTISPLEGTYLLWVDLGGVIAPEKIQEFLLEECKIAPDFGFWFHPEEGAQDTHVRLNLAAPRKTVEKAADQLESALRRALANSGFWKNAK